MGRLFGHGGGRGGDRDRARAISIAAWKQTPNHMKQTQSCTQSHSMAQDWHKMVHVKREYLITRNGELYCKLHMPSLNVAIALVLRLIEDDALSVYVLYMASWWEGIRWQRIPHEDYELLP